VADARIWSGTPPEGSSRLGFWHLAAFAWVCNMAMHLGLSDMAILRYARRPAYGLHSGWGMFLGHYVAWVCAGVMGAAAALAIGRPIAELDSGAVAFNAIGVAGAVAVVIAGWTTSNPTIYRAGLALQAVTPDWPRWAVTLAAGTVTTLVACFPFVFTRLLDFVGVYGMLLAPVGGIVAAEHFWRAKGRVTPDSDPSGGASAGVAWGISIALAAALWLSGTVHLFFLAVPAWLLSAVLYAALRGRRTHPATDEASEAPAAEPPDSGAIDPTPPVNRLAAGVAMIALLGCLAVAVWVAVAGGELYRARVETAKILLATLSVVYFAAATLWIRRRKRAPGTGEENDENAHEEGK
jgi:NCS1 family nucleobase:cation symporter-1